MAPPGFGSYGDQLIRVNFGGQVIAFNTAARTSTVIGVNNKMLNEVEFGPDGKLYVLDHLGGTIEAMTSDGVFTPLIAGLKSPNGMTIDGDGGRLFVVNNLLPDPLYKGRLDQVSLPGGVLTPGPAIKTIFHGYPAGVIVDSADNVLVKVRAEPWGGLLDAFKAP